MNSLKDSPYYHEAFNELVYDFGTFYLFDSFIVGEVNPGMVLKWEDHGKKMVDDIFGLYDSDGADIVYISNRVNDYSMVPSDWIKFYRSNYKLKGYAMVNYSKNGHVMSLLEKLFISNKSRRFNNLNQAIRWAKSKAELKYIAS